jgi:prepilin-type N-terminal cleavage/methylation domain-containing protein
MSTGRVRSSRGGFTLLEITLAVAILAMMSLAIYRFVQTNIVSIRVSGDQMMEDARYTGLLNLLTAQWQSLPSGQGRLTGEPFKFNDRPRDEITWICGPGPGLLTRYAPGEFMVTMRLRPVSQGSDHLQLGILRKPQDTSDPSPENESWVTLLPEVQSMQIRYFDPRLNAWVDKWTDTSTLPRLVKLVIGQPGSQAPWEAIVALGRTPL